MDSKQFPIAAIGGVLSGTCLEERGMAGIQSVMDHFYPGIMTIGCAAMQPAAAAEIRRQLPALAEWFGMFHHVKDYSAFVESTRREFGDTLPLDGPLEVSDSEVEAAFAAIQR